MIASNYFVTANHIGGSVGEIFYLEIHRTRRRQYSEIRLAISRSGRLQGPFQFRHRSTAVRQVVKLISVWSSSGAGPSAAIQCLLAPIPTWVAGHGACTILCGVGALTLLVQSSAIPPTASCCMRRLTQTRGQMRRTYHPVTRAEECLY